jgi:hypothetical protein
LKLAYCVEALARDPGLPGLLERLGEASGAPWEELREALKDAGNS